ncbi:uncharacterized protein LOC107272452 [Cephus cinctus]|uniref:Uncharacterized protein LOC107272452 n=1 Tax=Cephus cinctus TaxID=211228 RepID=A0AAJ7FRT7_CEPCN|nr:uncharacterized protein LOC107272452 [Cephus cinctus]
MMTDTVVTVQNAPSYNVYNSTQTPTIKTDPGRRGIFSGITVNVLYLTTIPGIIKIIELVLAIICMICATPLNVPATYWFLFVVWIVFIGTIVSVFLYILSIDKKMKLPINWYLFELLNTALIIIVYATAFILQLSAWSPLYNHYYRGGNIAAGVFGMFNTIAYATGMYFHYLDWKNTTA